MNEIAVSIICNTYNHEKYIRNALDGFVMQKTNFPFEVLIHDDASDDHTPDIIREYELKYPEIIKPIYDTENQYSKHDGSLKRIQFARVKGEYIASCEGDDYWTDPNKLQSQYDYMISHPDCTLCTHDALLHRIDTGESKRIIGKDKDFDISIKKAFDRGESYPTCSFFAKKYIYTDRPLCFNARGFGDYQAVLYASIEGKCHYLHNVMSTYNKYTENSFSKRTEHNDNVLINHYTEIICMLSCVNEYYEKKYNRYISNRITKCEFAILQLKKDYHSMMKPKYIPLLIKSILVKMYLFVKT